MSFLLRFSWRPCSRRLVVFLAVALAFLAPAFAEEEPKDEPAPPAAGEPASKPREYGIRQGPGVGREQMWPAPTAKDWAKPCLLTFQRTWEDAVAVSKETGKPILCCINMDGEIASEHYAGVRYREPDIAALYTPYVCVIASVYRHTLRDHDDQGRRILCPRFGSVTCGEHIAIEPLLFEKFLDGKRVAPRHIMVDLDGKELYDLYYINDTASVFDAIRDGPSKVPEPKPIVVRGDRPIVERVGSRDVKDRAAVEGAYRQGDASLRKALLEAAAKHSDKAPLDLLRLAVLGLDVDNARLARQVLARSTTPAATPLISEALQAPMDTAERDRLIATLKKLGDASALARWLAGVHQGLATRSGAVDPTAWSKALGSDTYPSPGTDTTLTTRAEKQARAMVEKPDDPEPRLEFAESTLELALESRRTYAANPGMGQRIARHLYADARRSALEAEKLGATGWRLETVLALTAYYSGDVEEGYKRADAAMKGLPPGEMGWNSMAVVTVFAESRWMAIKQAVRENKEWPAEYLADLHAAYSVLRRHPLGTDDQVVWHYELLMWLGAREKAVRVLYDGLERFRDSEALHERLRTRLLRRRGPTGLEAAYEELLAKQADPVRLEAFAGIASIFAADQLRRMRKYDEARAAYGRGIAHYEAAVEAHPGHRPGADHAIALALAGRARVAYQVSDDDAALADVLDSLERSPESAGTRDGMGITPGETAQVLLARLKESDRLADAERLEGALAVIDPELLRPDRE